MPDQGGLGVHLTIDLAGKFFFICVCESACVRLYVGGGCWVGYSVHIIAVVGIE